MTNLEKNWRRWDRQCKMEEVARLKFGILPDLEGDVYDYLEMYLWKHGQDYKMVARQVCGLGVKVGDMVCRGDDECHQQAKYDTDPLWLVDRMAEEDFDDYLATPAFKVFKSKIKYYLVLLDNS